MRFLKYTVGATVAFFVLVIIAGALAGSGSGDAKDSPPNAPKPAKEAASCEAVPTALLNQIAGFIKPETGATLRGARAVHVDDGAPSGTWYVAADLEGPGLDGDDQIVVVPIAVLRAGGGHLFGIGGYADQFTSLRHTSMWAITNPGAKAAQSCVKAAL